MKTSLVLLDTDHIKRYVFATDKLKEIRGGSALFDELNRIEMEKIVKSFDPRAEKIYANGGTGMFIVSFDDPDDIIQAVQQKYWEHTITGSITGVAEELPEDWKNPEKKQQVSELVQRLFLKLQLANAETRETTTIMSHALLKDCESCDTEYAVEKYEEEFLCQSCVKKRKQDGAIKKEITSLLQQPETLKIEEEKLWRRLLATLKDKLTGRNLERPEDSNQLGNLSKPEHYIGLIYADGNNMGALIDALIANSPTPISTLRAFADGVDNAIRDSVIKAVRQHLLPDKDQRIFPFDILLLGGDDLVMLTTAQKAIETAITIVKEFNERTKALDENGLTLSVSIMLAHAKFPFGTLLSLAEDALKSAKKRYAELKRDAKMKGEPLDVHGMINFMVVHSANTMNFSKIYRHELQDRSQHVYRTLRPYPVEQMEQLRSAITTSLHNVPKAKLHQVQEAIFQDKQHAMLATLTSLLRAKEQDKRNILKLVEDFAVLAKTEQLAYPWYILEKDGKNHYYTPLLDAIELYDFVEKRKEEEKSEGQHGSNHQKHDPNYLYNHVQ